MHYSFIWILMSVLLYPQIAQTALSMDASIQAALKYNPTLQSSHASKQAATHEVRKAQAAYYPTIGLWGGAGFRQADDVSSRAYNESKTMRGVGQLGLSLSQTVWDGGATDALVVSKQALMQGADSLVNDTANTVCFAAIAAHIDVYRRRLMLDLAQQNVLEHEKIFQTVKTRYDQAIASAGEVDQVKSRLARAKATYMTHVVGLEAALANYWRITGVKSPPDLIAVPLPQQVFPDPNRIKTLAIDHNPRILTDLATIKAFLGEKSYANSGFFPKFNIEAGPAYADKTGPSKNYSLTLEAMLRLRWDFYSGGADQAAVQASSARVRKARLDLQTTMDILNEDIEASFIRTKYAQDQAQEFAIASAASERSRINFFDQFLAGQRSLLDVLDAGSESFASAIENLTYSTDHVLGSYRLLALAGVLLEECKINIQELQNIPSQPDTDNPSTGLTWSSLNAQPQAKTIKP